MRISRVVAVAALLTLTTLVTACGDDDKDSESEPTVTETVSATPSETTSAPPPTTAPPTSVTPMDPTGRDITVEQVNAALLTPEEIGPGLELGTWTDESTPPPCDQAGTPIDTQVPPSVESGVEINTSDGQAAITEVISIYDTEDLANQAFSLGTAGLDCSAVTLDDGTTATIAPPEDVTGQVNTSGVGSSTAWQITGEGYKVLLVATLSGRIILTSTFTAVDDADTSALPAPIDIAALAFAKALAN